MKAGTISNSVQAFINYPVTLILLAQVIVSIACQMMGFYGAFQTRDPAMVVFVLGLCFPITFIPMNLLGFVWGIFKKNIALIVLSIISALISVWVLVLVRSGNAWSFFAFIQKLQRLFH